MTTETWMSTMETSGTLSDEIWTEENDTWKFANETEIVFNETYIEENDTDINSNETGETVTIVSNKEISSPCGVLNLSIALTRTKFYISKLKQNIVSIIHYLLKTVSDTVNKTIK